MEEKKNKKTLYLVLGITLLSVLALGGVYAYFAARVTTNEGAITGQTLDINGGTLTITAQRVNLSPSPTPVSDNLVPANFGVSPSEMTTTEVNRALDSKCVGGGYTGCHVWKVTARSTIDIPSANVKLNLSLTSVIDPDEWSYIVYTGEDTSSSTVINKGNIITSFPTSSTTIDIHNGASLTANTPVYYYVMVYLNNINSAQNDGVTTGTTNEKGTYNGTVTLEAMGGQVKVDFLDRTTPTEYFIYEINNNEVTITGYKEAAATYTVTNQNACESYMENLLLEWDYDSSDATTYATALCSGGVDDYDGTLGDYIIGESIPSSDYAFAGLSNVVSGPAPTDVVIPSTIEGYPVTTIDIQAFSNKGLTSVVIPSSVTTLGDFAFGSNSLTSVEIPSSVTTIGTAAFVRNSLTSIEIPSSVTEISSSAFANNQLTSVEIPNSITTIGSSAFTNNQLTSVDIPSSVTTIGDYAFRSNPLTSITIGNNSVSIGCNAFGDNPPLDEPFLSNYGCN